jgi:hypothetical protein
MCKLKLADVCNFSTGIFGLKSNIVGLKSRFRQENLKMPLQPPIDVWKWEKSCQDVFPM